MVVDDFAPHGSKVNVQRLDGKADRVFRGQGNGAGRGRADIDGSLREPKPPRAAVIATGEDIPTGHSLRARLLIAEVSPGDISTAQLSLCQEQARSGLYELSLAGFIQWIAGRYEAVRDSIEPEIERLRSRAVGQHSRTPGIVASLSVGLHLFTEFAEEIGALTSSEAEEIRCQGWRALNAAAAGQATHQKANEPALRYIELLKESLASGRSYVATLDGLAPLGAGDWGWRRNNNGFGSETGMRDWQAQGEHIGWIDVENDDLYLLPEAAYGAVTRRANEPLPIATKTIHKRLNERGYLKTTDSSRGTLTVRRSIGESRIEVLHLRASALLSGKSYQSDQQEQDQGSLSSVGNNEENEDFISNAEPDGSDSSVPLERNDELPHGVAVPIGQIGQVNAEENSPTVGSAPVLNTSSCPSSGINNRSIDNNGIDNSGTGGIVPANPSDDGFVNHFEGEQLALVPIVRPPSLYGQI